jgi:Xaa-Pro dipeptidase
MHAARLKRLRAAIANAQLDGVAAIAGPNLQYLTGLSFHLSERPTVGFFPAQGDPVFVVGALEESKITAGAPYAVKTFAYTDADGPAAAFGQAAQALKLGRLKLGVEGRRMRVMEYQFLEEAAPGVKMTPAEEIFAALRMVKDEAEIAAMRKATLIAEAALRNTLPTIKNGQTEREVAAELVVQTLRAGSDADLPFAPIVASGPNSALPHAFVTDRVIQAGDLLTLDWGAASGGYFSDLTRTFAVGEISAELKKIYALVLAANAAGRAAARPGVTCASIDAAARKVITDGGYGEYFTHRVGHGLGMEGHEDPSMHGNNTLKLEAGMTFTVEPGIYVPNVGGARIEDDMVVTQNGAESLSSYPRELEVIHL